MALLRRTAVPKQLASAALLYFPDMDGVNEVKNAHVPVLHDVIERVLDLAVIETWGERRKLVLDQLVSVFLSLAVEVLKRKTWEVGQPE